MDEDIALAQAWLINLATEVVRHAHAHDKIAGVLAAKASLVLACADLPGDMPLRVRCLADVFEWHC